MHPRRFLWRLLPVALVAALAVAGLAPAASGGVAPSFRLFAATSKIVAHKGGNAAWVDPGMWLASTGGAVELWLSRPNYETPIDLIQVDAETGAVVRDLPEDVLEGLWGLDRFFRITVRDVEGDLVRSMTRDFCPNESQHQRVDDEGPVNPQYPWQCGGSHPLVLGTVWGIEEGWAADPLGFEGAIPMQLPVGKYTLEMRIREPYVTLFDVPAPDASDSVQLFVMKGGGGGGGEMGAAREAQGTGAFEAGVPEVTDPDPSTLPDLVAMPAWSFQASSRKSGDYLTFAATEWNAGPQPLVVEGFRRPGTQVMDAYQYFYQGGEPVGRAEAGILHYHGAHAHWHFAQFTEYSLLDATKAHVVKSGKQSWCLAPTDAIDLTVEGAELLPGSVGFTACGSASSIWVREILDVGWGDTYYQYVVGQAFPITDVPNGVYYVKVEVNPTGVLHETDTGNNVVLRRIRLTGTPGHRGVSAGPWHGIDTEGGFGGSAGS